MGQLKKLLFCKGQRHQWALEQTGQGIIIRGQKHKLHQCHDIKDGDVLRKLKAVRASNRNSGLRNSLIRMSKTTCVLKE
jgi:hypothetical protein